MSYCIRLQHDCVGPLAGQAVPQDSGLSYALMEAAAARGDPTAQGAMGFQQSLGLHPPPDRSQRPFSFGPTDPPRALLNYYFAASGNDSFSQMVLGYRHAHGLGVPKSCEAAVLYYHPVAEETIALAARPNSLPLVSICLMLLWPSNTSVLENGRSFRGGARGLRTSRRDILTQP